MAGESDGVAEDRKDENRYVKRFNSKIRNINKQFYDVVIGEYKINCNLGDFLNDDELMWNFVEEYPDDAFALHNRVMMWKYKGANPTEEIALFFGADLKIGEAFVDCYGDNLEYSGMVGDVLNNMDRRKLASNGDYSPCVGDSAERNSRGTRGKFG